MAEVNLAPIKETPGPWRMMVAGFALLIAG